MISSEFVLFIDDFNRIISNAKINGDFIKKDKVLELTNDIEKRLNMAITLYPKELEILFSTKRIDSTLNEMKKFCHKFGQITYKLNTVGSEILIKKGNRWAHYKTVSVEDALTMYFGIGPSDKFYSFIGSFLSTEENFTLIQVFSVLFNENKQLN